MKMFKRFEGRGYTLSLGRICKPWAEDQSPEFGVEVSFPYGDWDSLRVFASRKEATSSFRAIRKVLLKKGHVTLGSVVDATHKSSRTAKTLIEADGLTFEGYKS